MRSRADEKKQFKKLPKSTTKLEIDPDIKQRNELEMMKDAGYRMLNEKLREKEYRLRELQASKQQEEQLAERIEREVMEKLSKSLKLGSLLKPNGLSRDDSRVENESIQIAKNDKSTGNKSGYGDRSHSGTKARKSDLKRSKGITSTDSQDSSNTKLNDKSVLKKKVVSGEPVPFTHQSHNPSDKSLGTATSLKEPRRSEGGLIRVPWLPQRAASQSPSNNPTTINENETKSITIPADPQQSQIKSLEALFQKTLESVRHNGDKARNQSANDRSGSLKGGPSILENEKVLTYCVLGPSNGCPELARVTTELETAYTEAITSTRLCARTVGYAGRVWSMRQHLLRLFIDTIDAATPRSARGDASRVEAGRRALDSSQLTQITQHFDSELRLTEETVDLLIQYLLQQRDATLQECPELLHGLHALTCNAYSEPPSDLRREEAEMLRSLCEVIQQLYMARAELIRYQHHYGKVERADEKWVIQFLELCETAKAVAPWVGGPYKAMANAAKQRGDTFLTVYWLMRAMCVQKPVQTRETLLEVLESVKDAEGEVTHGISATLSLSLLQHQLHFQRSFLQALRVCISRVGADKLHTHLDSFRRHLASVIHTLGMFTNSTTATAHSKKAPQADAFFSFNKAGFEVQSTEEAAEMVLSTLHTIRANGLADTLPQTLILCLSATQMICEKASVKASVAKTTWRQSGLAVDLGEGASAAASSEGLPPLPPEERVIAVKRFTSVTLHRVQSVPGLVDAWRLSVNFLSALLGAVDSLGLGLASTGTSYSHSVRHALTVTLVSVSVVSYWLGWLNSNLWTHPLILVDSKPWSQLESQLDKYLQALETVSRLLAPRGSDVSKWWSEAQKTCLNDISPFTVDGDEDLRGYLPLADTLPPPTRQPKDAEGVERGPGETEVRQVLLKILRCRIYASKLVGRDIVMGPERVCGKDSTPSMDDILDSGVSFDASTRMAQPLNPNAVNSVRLKVLSLPCYSQSLASQGGGKKPMKLTDKVSITSGFQGSSGKSGSTSALLSEREFNLLARLGGVDLDEETAEEEVAKDGGSEAPTDITEDDLRSEGNSEESSDVGSEGVAEDADSGPESVEMDAPIDVKPNEAENENPVTSSPKGGLLRMSNMDAVLNPEKQTEGLGKPLPQGKRSSRSRGRDHSRSIAGYRPPPPPLKTMPSLPLIVVDAPNVAMRHGLNARFSCVGIQVALEYFTRAGHKVLGFLPDYYLQIDRVNAIRNLAKADIQGAAVRASRVPDDVGLLQQLVLRGLLVGTPSQDYDDSYCITYARRHDGYVITNDMYRDHQKGSQGKGKDKGREREELRNWIQTHTVSYTFVGDEFLPNPDFSFNKR